MKLQKHPPEVFCEKGALKNFANFRGKHLCWKLLFNKVAGLKTCSFIKKRLQRKCFPLKFAKFLRAPIVKNICERLLPKSKKWCLFEGVLRF